MSGLLALLVAVTGLHGVVMRGPTKPVCEIGTPCSEPAVGATLAFAHSGHVVVRVKTGKGGRYAVRLAPGLYAVRLVPAQRIGGLKPVQVRVRPGVSARVNFAIDTGIR
jgi:hypothetical protein